MRTPLNVTLASRDFRLPLSPEYASAARSGYEYIRDHLGYRIELRSARLPQQLSVHDSRDLEFVFEAALVNWGFAAPDSPRPVQLVLLATNGTIVWSSATLADPRDWQPYTPGDPTFLPLLHRLRDTVSIPASALQCEVGSCVFEFGLYLPDMRQKEALAAGLLDVGAYCIQLANSNMPWVQGINMLAKVQVDSV